eukprot:snap_masked-scaffold_18-processed-gene-2.47-mRNA-1 protein AED:0.10 eAED:0.10 QI:0/-1/0/1/-1/1/1/0/154
MSEEKTQEQQQVNLASLSIEQLRQLFQQLRQEQKVGGNNLVQLNVALNKLNQSKIALDNLNTSTEKDVLCPLSNSMYIPAKIKTTKEVSIELGSGFFVKKNIKEGKEFFDRKLKMVEATLQAAEKEMMAKRSQMENIQAILRYKIQEETKTGPA